MINRYNNENEELSLLIKALDKSSFALYELLRNLENDGYIKSINEAANPVCEDICAEIAGVSLGIMLDYLHNNNLEVNESQIAIDIISDILSNIISARIIEESIIANGRHLADSNDQYKPEGFLILNSFDQMSQSFDGAFYNNMKVDNPGNLSDYYKELLGGYIQLICVILGKDITNHFVNRVDLIYG